MRSMKKYLALVAFALALMLGACGQGQQGPKGEQGPPGPQGRRGLGPAPPVGKQFTRPAYAGAMRELIATRRGGHQG